LIAAKRFYCAAAILRRAAALTWRFFGTLAVGSVAVAAGCFGAALPFLSWSALCTIASRVPESSVASPLEIKSAVQSQISSVLVARRISDVKAETLANTSRTQFAHAFDLKLSGCGHQAPVLCPALLRAKRSEHLRRAAKPIHAILLPNGERRPERWERADPDPTAVHMKDAPSPAAENGRFGLVQELASVRSLYRSPPDASDGHKAIASTRRSFCFETTKSGKCRFSASPLRAKPHDTFGTSR
jgi:hypothetical protein